MSFFGEAEHALDDKGRFVIPAIFRDSLHGPLYFALGDEGEVAIWPQTGFDRKLAQKQAKELEGREGARELRLFTSNAANVKVDAQFRVAIPESLRQKAGLVREVTIIGAADRIEIWDKSTYATYMDAGA